MFSTFWTCSILLNHGQNSVLVTVVLDSLPDVPSKFAKNLHDYDFKSLTPFPQPISLFLFRQ